MGRTQKLPPPHFWLTCREPMLSCGVRRVLPVQGGRALHLPAAPGTHEKRKKNFKFISSPQHLRQYQNLVFLLPPKCLLLSEFSSFIVLYTTFVPPEAHLAFLTKGANFCPVPPSIDELEVRLDLASWKRRVRLKFS
jgi:hypothetical protein